MLSDVEIPINFMSVIDHEEKLFVFVDLLGDAVLAHVQQIKFAFSLLSGDFFQSAIVSLAAV